MPHSPTPKPHEPTLATQAATALSFGGSQMSDTVGSPLGTVTPPDDASPSVTPTPVPVLTPPAPSPPPKPVLSNDMRTILREVGSLECDETTRKRMYALLYESNVALHDTCIADSGYQFFPYTSKLPTTTQLLAIVKSTACMQIYAGAILAKFPECDIDFVSVRSSAEVYYRVKHDIDAERVPPTQAQFYELYNLNRVVNLLTENASLVEDVLRNTSTAAAVSLSEMTRVMNPIVLLPNVVLNDKMNVTMVTSPPSTTASQSNITHSLAIDAKSGSQSYLVPPITQAPTSTTQSSSSTTKVWTDTTISLQVLILALVVVGI